MGAHDLSPSVVNYVNMASLSLYRGSQAPLKGAYIAILQIYGDTAQTQTKTRQAVPMHKIIL